MPSTLNLLTRWTPRNATYYLPLDERTVAALGAAPHNITAEAAFDAWPIYQTCAVHGGLAAIPLNTRGRPPPQRQSDGTPLCPKGLAMSPSYVFAHTDGYRAQEVRCPLLHPQPAPQTCAHEQFAKGPGCVKHITSEAGGLMRVLLDRDSAAYKDLYRQRTAAERINAQAKALGIERPKVRNGASVRNLNTLTYLVINVQALQRAQAFNVRAAIPPPMLC